MRFSRHGLDRLKERGITADQVQWIVDHHLGPPEPGDGGNLVFSGKMDGRRLGVVTSADREVFVTAYWRD